MHSHIAHTIVRLQQDWSPHWETAATGGDAAVCSSVGASLRALLGGPDRQQGHV